MLSLMVPEKRTFFCRTTETASRSESGVVAHVAPADCHGAFGTSARRRQIGWMSEVLAEPVPPRCRVSSQFEGASPISGQHVFFGGGRVLEGHVLEDDGTILSVGRTVLRWSTTARRWGPRDTVRGLGAIVVMMKMKASISMCQDLDAVGDRRQAALRPLSY